MTIPDLFISNRPKPQIAFPATSFTIGEMTGKSAKLAVEVAGAADEKGSDLPRYLRLRMDLYIGITTVFA